MKQYIANPFGRAIKFVHDAGNQRLVVISVFVILFACLFLLLFRNVSRHGGPVSANNTSATPISITPIIAPTKWWIKATSTSSPSSLNIATPADLEGMPASDCPSTSSSLLQAGIYAYISLTPSLPNRIRSGAGKVNSNLGQIEPGAAVRVLDGPLCVDGLSWWLVESTQGDLRGWTVDGRESEQWIIPCPDQTVACDKKPLPTQSSPASKDNHKTTDKECGSEQLTIGILAQVEQGSLLVIRSEPNIGDIVGRVGPLSVVNIVDGPSCEGDTVWWRVSIATLNLSGWAAENSLYACTKKDGCD